MRSELSAAIAQEDTDGVGTLEDQIAIGIGVEVGQFQSGQRTQPEVGGVGTLPATVTRVECGGELPEGRQGQEIEGRVGIEWPELEGQGLGSGGQRRGGRGGDGEHQAGLELFQLWQASGCVGGRPFSGDEFVHERRGV